MQDKNPSRGVHPGSLPRPFPGSPEELAPSIPPVDPDLEARVQARLDRLTKPPGSLGRLEEVARRYAAARAQVRPTLSRKAVYVFAADHGVVAEGVSAYPREVTAQMVWNFLRGGAAVIVLARHVGAAVRVVDIGVDADFEAAPGLLHRKVARGSRNLFREPALSREEAWASLRVGWELAQEAAREGMGLLAVGDMGIGNTTPSSALVAVFTGTPVEAVTGRGTGVDEPVWQQKVSVIQGALERHQPDPRDPVGVLAAVGGLEIGGMAGMILGASACRIPVVLDGLIAGAAALVAVALAPRCLDYLFAAHRSVEPGHRAVLKHLGLVPLLDLGMRLGEGTGALLGMSLVEAGVRILNEMATFEEAGVSDRG